MEQLNKLQTGKIQKVTKLPISRVVLCRFYLSV